MRSSVVRKKLPEYLGIALSNVAGADNADARKVVEAILTAVSNLDAEARGLSWQSEPDSLGGVVVSVQMMHLSGEDDEELWAVSVASLTKVTKVRDRDRQPVVATKPIKNRGSHQTS
jgi:hypothetical protein